jgi:hypothetical protein
MSPAARERGLFRRSWSGPHWVRLVGAAEVASYRALAGCWGFSGSDMASRTNLAAFAIRIVLTINAMKATTIRFRRQVSRHSHKSTLAKRPRSSGGAGVPATAGDVTACSDALATPCYQRSSGMLERNSILKFLPFGRMFWLSGNIERIHR